MNMIRKTPGKASATFGEFEIAPKAGALLGR